MYKIVWEQRKEGSILVGLEIVFGEALHKRSWSKLVFIGLVRVHLIGKVKTIQTKPQHE